MTRAIAVEPLSPVLRADMGQIEYFAGREAEAIEHCRLALEADPDFVNAHLYLYEIYSRVGRYDEAVAVYLRLGELLDSHPLYGGPTRGQVDAAYRSGGVRKFWRALLDLQAQHGSDPYTAAEIYARLGQKDDALRSLHQAVERRHFGLAFVRANPAFWTLRDELEFGRVLQRVGLPPWPAPVTTVSGR